MVLAGPGTVKIRSSKTPTAIQVTIGCEGRIWIEQGPMIHQLKEQAREGIISEVLRLPLIGWRVKTETRAGSTRKRRNAADDQGIVFLAIILIFHYFHLHRSLFSSPLLLFIYFHFYSR